MTSPVVVSSPIIEHSDTPIPVLVSEALARQAVPAGTAVDQALLGAGFVRDMSLKQAYTARAHKENLSHNGNYLVQDVWTKGVVTLVFEQNTAMETIGGLPAAVQHPAVCVASSPAGRVACNALDPELILSVAAELG